MMDSPIWLEAPTDNAASHVEHAMALTGLGVDGLLIALAISSEHSSVAELAKAVERAKHARTPTDVVALVHAGAKAWRLHRQVDDGSFPNQVMIDQRAFAERFPEQTGFEGPSHELPLLAACWLMNQRIEEHLDGSDDC